jgi:hypothetical protein
MVFAHFVQKHVMRPNADKLHNWTPLDNTILRAVCNTCAVVTTTKMVSCTCCLLSYTQLGTFLSTQHTSLEPSFHKMTAVLPNSLSYTYQFKLELYTFKHYFYFIFISVVITGCYSTNTSTKKCNFTSSFCHILTRV